MRTVVHVTHEAVVKIGGIGAVLQGLLTTKHYNERVNRTILVQPLWDHGCPLAYRLGDGGTVSYSSLDGVFSGPYTAALQKIEQTYHTPIVYGHRRFVDPETGVSCHAEVLLIDLHQANPYYTNICKFKLFERFGIDSRHYESIWDYEQWVRLAEPALAAVQAIGAVPPHGHCVVVSHEFMGIPTALTAVASEVPQFRSLFYAHEVATMRRIVESHPAHDTMFYNVLRLAEQQGRFVEDIFGSQADYYKHGLLQGVPHMDSTLAVGDDVVREMRFLGPAFRQASIDLTYNGIHAWPTSIDERREAKARLQQYAYNLLGYKPDYIFTHVTRLVPSKGLWRDLRVMEQLDPLLGQLGKRAALFVLSTELPARPQQEIERMEADYRWPTAHREGHGDLTGGEAAFYLGVQDFNTKARNATCVYFNQFGWNRQRLGARCPENMDTWDIRRGSDVEFGQSIYEPYGIAQVEALAFGAICVIGSPCGCAGHAKAILAGKPSRNLIVADYTQAGLEGTPRDQVESYLKMTRADREAVEQKVAGQIAKDILERLPKTDKQAAELLAGGFAIGQEMNWEQVVQDYVLPAMDRVCLREPSKVLGPPKAAHSA